MSAVSAGAVALSDWTKIRTIRSTTLSLLLTPVVCVGISYLFALMFGQSLSSMSPRQQADFDPLFVTFYSFTLGQLAIVVYGVQVVSSEYSSGTIRASLAAVPQRGLFYVCKLCAGALPAVGVSAVTALAAFHAAQAGLGQYAVSLDSEEVRKAVVGAFLYLPLMCLFAMGVAMILRNSALTLGTLLPLLFLGSMGLGNIPKVKTVAQYLPDQAGSVIMHFVGPEAGPRYDRDYGHWTGLGILAIWTAAAVIGGYVTLRRRDA